MTNQRLHGCGSGLTGAFTNERGGANDVQEGSDPPLAKFFFPHPALPVPIKFAAPAFLISIAVVLPKLTVGPHPAHKSLPAPVRVEWERIALIDTNLMSPAAEQTQRPIRRSVRLFVPAGIGVMVVGILLAGPSSIMTHQLSAKRYSDAVPPVPKPEMVEVVNATSTLESSYLGTKSRVSLYASDRSWVVACVDDKLLFAKLFTPGNRRTLEFDRRAIVRVGSAGSVHVVIDGNPPATMGRSGEVRIMEFTPGDSHFLIGGEVEDCTEGH